MEIPRGIIKCDDTKWWRPDWASNKGEGYNSIYCLQAGRYFYIGRTSNLWKRLKVHNQPTSGNYAMNKLKQMGLRKWDMIILKKYITDINEAAEWELSYQKAYESPYQISLKIDKDYFDKHLLINLNAPNLYQSINLGAYGSKREQINNIY